jgi:hypothetical protein
MGTEMLRQRDWSWDIEMVIEGHEMMLVCVGQFLIASVHMNTAFTF